ncbi:photosynthetic complex assembly protein PuhC [Thermochromatium tepidum]|uniref:Phosphonoacetaldehyde hydrolase n=1 Tax=Thermochromatium tepidum ATCC 43061 TaxID=316276 RepID=A0A6I6E4E1_THETI|nr:photosynthetic complex assembly protein PuhC [Thermochromatium tepidum]QGU33845.1 phosphonoacetaldehyde hydrolase [Thermochromatium tepidum ATCC 43061]
MSDASEGRAFPKGVLIAVGILLGLTIVMVAVARLTGYRLPQAPFLPEVESRDIRFIAQPDGSMSVRDAATDELIQTLPPGSEGFVRGMLRGLERQRKGYKADISEPFHLARREDGMLTLEDPITGIRLDLRAYGVDNAAAFAVFLRSVPVRH